MKQIETIKCEICIHNRDKKIKIDLRNEHLGAFLGAFISEGNLTEYTLKISSKDLKFLDYITNSVKKVFGHYGTSQMPPTMEDKNGEKGFHKYYLSPLVKVLVEGYGIKPGRKVLNNQGLPEILTKNATLNSEIEWVKRWLKAYLQTRYSGDGHVRNSINIGKNGTIITRRIALSKNIALKNIDNKILKIIKENYESKKPINKYPKELIELLKKKARKRDNFPKEFLDIQRLLKRLFGINSIVYYAGLIAIYFDKKRERFIISSKYRLVISRKEDIVKFYKKINFAPCDIKNRKKLINVIKSYKR